MLTGVEAPNQTLWRAGMNSQSGQCRKYMKFYSEL